MLRTVMLWGFAWACTGALFAQSAPQDSLVRARYALEVRAFPAYQEGATRYELVLRMPEGDRLSAIFGTDQHPMVLSTPEGAFNSPYNGSWSASGMNPKFFEIMPEMQDDSFATIGLRTAARASGLEGAEDPTMVQDPGEPWDAFFTEDGAKELRMASWTGGAWFVVRTAANGASRDGEVLVAQVTTTGTFSGTFNAHVFPNVEGVDQAKVRMTFHGPGFYPAELLAE